MSRGGEFLCWVLSMHLGIGGTVLPLRPAAVKGRAGKQADGMAQILEGKLIAQ